MKLTEQEKSKVVAAIEFYTVKQTNGGSIGVYPPWNTQGIFTAVKRAVPQITETNYTKVINACERFKNDHDTTAFIESFDLL